MYGLILVYLPGGGLSVQRRPRNEPPPLDDLQGAVGGSVEAIRSRGYGSLTWAFCNEDRETIPASNRRVNVPFEALTGDKRFGRIVVTHGFDPAPGEPLGCCGCLGCTEGALVGPAEAAAAVERILSGDRS